MPDTDTTRTEADAVAQIAERSAVQPTTADVAGFDGLTTAITPDGVHRHLLDQQAHEREPRRARGTVEVHDADSFVDALAQRTKAPVGLYADETRTALVAIINDDTVEGAGWRDYRVSLNLRTTPEWERWTSGQGLGPQERFALAIEAGEDEIVDPSPAHMLELAQSFHASVGSRFRQGGRLDNGERQLLYEEDIEAKAGANGEMSIPPEFSIDVAPFVGSEEVEVRARLRYRVGGGQFVIGYELVHPERVEREAFESVVADVEEALGRKPVAGPAPAEARPIEVTVRAIS